MSLRTLHCCARIAILLLVGLSFCCPFVSRGPTISPSRSRKTRLDDGPDATKITTSAAETFCDVLAKAISGQSLTEFTLYGPKARGASSTSTTTTTTTVDDDIRGRLKRVQGRPVALKKQTSNGMLQVTYKFHGATDVAKNYHAHDVVDTVIRPLLLEGRSVVDSEWGPAVTGAVGTTPYDSLQGARLETTTHQWEFQATYGKKQRLVSRKAKLGDPNNRDSNHNEQVQAHDRVKQRPLAPTDAVWPALGLATKDGKPKPGKKAKLAQAQKFVEIVSRLIHQQLPLVVSSTTTTPTTTTTRDDNDNVHDVVERLRIFDMGCGRGYLTFALHAHLMQHSSNNDSKWKSVETFGIDVRPKLVKDMNEMAKSLNFDGLAFLQGTIEEYMVHNNSCKVNASADTNTDDGDNNNNKSLKVWLALHACDTATDDALWSGIVQQADILVVAPCCHKELRPQLDKSMPMPDVLRHGIFRQRWAATLTDSIRVLLLEMAGYQVQVMEFVQSADTPQNVMITAVKQRGSSTRKRDVASARDQVRQKLVNLTQSHGVEHQALATWMGESLAGKNGASHQTMGLRQMPPL